MNDTKYTPVLVSYSLGNSKQPGFCQKSQVPRPFRFTRLSEPFGGFPNNVRRRRLCTCISFKQLLGHLNCHLCILHTCSLVLVTPFTKHLYGCKALLHTLVKYSFVEFLFTRYTSFFFVCYSIKPLKCTNSRKMQYNAISVTAEKVSAPKPIPIPMVSADTFGRYRISVGHYSRVGKVPPVFKVSIPFS